MSSVLKLIPCLVKGGTLISPESGVLLSILTIGSGGTFSDCLIGFFGTGDGGRSFHCDDVTSSAFLLLLEERVSSYAFCSGTGIREVLSGGAYFPW